MYDWSGIRNKWRSAESCGGEETSFSFESKGDDGFWKITDDLGKKGGESKNQEKDIYFV